MTQTYWEKWFHKLQAQSLVIAAKRNLPYEREAFDEGFVPFLTFLFEKEKEYRAESEASVRAFARTGELLEESAWAEYITFLRFEQAGELCAKLLNTDESGVEPPLICGKAENVGIYLLVDQWNRSFDWHLKILAVSVFHNLPLYGLEPAKE